MCYHQCHIIIDGVSTDSVNRPASDLKRDGVVAFCIGIGGDVNLAQLNYIASDPDDEFVFLLRSHNDLDPNEFVRFLDQATCKGK